MSKGSQVVPVRIPENLKLQIDIALIQRNENTRDAPYTLSDWIRKAIEEKLDHVRRSRKRKTSSS